MDNPVISITLSDILYKNIIPPLYIKNNVLSVYEQCYIHNNERNAKLNLYEIPIKRQVIIENEIIKGIPEAIYTCNISDTIEYIVSNSTLSNNNIIPFYYRDKQIPMCITIYDIYNENTNINMIISLFKECGYFLLYNEIINDNNIKYIKLYFEPYKPNVSIIRIPANIYNFVQDTDIISPDFFIGNDILNIKQYIKTNNSKKCLKINTPNNIIFFTDISKIKNNIIDHIYTYEIIDNTYINNIFNLNNIFIQI